MDRDSAAAGYVAYDIVARDGSATMRETYLEIGIALDYDARFSLPAALVGSAFALRELLLALALVEFEKLLHYLRGGKFHVSDHCEEFV